MKKSNWAITALSILGLITCSAAILPKPTPAGPPVSSPVPIDGLSGITITLPPSAFQPIKLFPGDLQEFHHLNNQQLQLLLGDLSITPQIPFQKLPRGGMAGNYYSLQNPTWPPLPGNITGQPVWEMNGASTYLINDITFDYEAAGKNHAKVQARASLAPPGGGGGGGSTNTVSSFFAAPNYGTNLWIANVTQSGGYLTGIGTNTQADVQYEIQSRTNLLQTDWQSEGFISGSELTNYTPLTVAQAGRPILFLRLRSWLDSFGIGIPDWWQIQYFGTNGISATNSVAGDGYSNLQKFQLNLNPTNYYNPNPPSGFYGYVAGTNVYLAWNSAPGPVVNYSIQKGVYSSNTMSYTYGTNGLLNTNTTLFIDNGAINNSNAWNNIYNLTAIYGGGSIYATDTWQASWFATNASAGPPYGPPLPGNPYALAETNGTNIVITWSPAGAYATNYLIVRGVYNTSTLSYQFTNIATVGPNTNTFKDIGAIKQANDWNNQYKVIAVYPGNGFSAPAISFISIGGGNNAAAAPAGFYGYEDSTGTNTYLNWTSATGAVSSYAVFGVTINSYTGRYKYTLAGMCGGGASGLTSVGQPYIMYKLIAIYTNGAVSQAASWISTYSPPPPSYVMAYVDATGTNVQVGWNSAPKEATGYVIKRSLDGGYTFELISSNTTSSLTYKDSGVVTSGSFDANSAMYGVQANYPNGVSSAFRTVLVSSSPPQPGSPSVTSDASGNNAVINWSPVIGPVTGYIIKQGYYNPSTGAYNFTQIGTAGANATTFTANGVLANQNTNIALYQIVAQFADGSTTTSGFSEYISGAYTGNGANATLVRNQCGKWTLVFSYIPPKIKAFEVTWDGYSFVSDSDDNLIQQRIIPVGAITNSCYTFSDSDWPNQLIGFIQPDIVGDWSGYKIYLQNLDANGKIGTRINVGKIWPDATYFVDGRSHLKQNLLFELRGATISQPVYKYDWTYNPMYQDFFDTFLIPQDLNYAESSIYHWAYQMKNGGATPDFVKLSGLWPIYLNYQLHPYLYDPNNQNVPSPFVFTNNNQSIPGQAVLGLGDPYWISQDMSYLGDVSAYEDSINLHLQANVKNLYGLNFASAMVGFDNNGIPISLAPGGSVGLTNVTEFSSQTADPVLITNGYYFAIVNTPGACLTGVVSQAQNQIAPLPVNLGFSPTNQSGIMIGAVGQPMTIGAWARYSIQGSSPTKYAYLGQYFTNTVLLNAAGTATTNTAGMISPYGEFFPTQAGLAKLTTLPDIDTGTQGSGIVRVISMNVDANHDGVMDLTYFGPDQTTILSPFRFWANDNQDDQDTGGDGIPSSSEPDGLTPVQVQNTGIPNFSFPSAWSIHGRRDLTDFFPVCLNIGSLFQSNAWSAGISASDPNYQFVLSQADGVLRFAYTDLTPTNYMKFLQDTNESGLLANAPLTTITPNGVVLTNAFVNAIASSNQNVILVEAAAPTTQPLILTIYRGTNQIAQTSLYLSISGVEQMFRYKNLLLSQNSSAPPERLTDASVPNEPDTINKNIVFVHGYNVDSRHARGWFTDVYKRFYWSGSHAKFYGVNWYGCQSQIGTTTPDYQVNVANAFQTAPNLANFIASLTNSGPVTVAAHSLGNMVTLSAVSDWSAPISQYFMLDAAVPIEAIDTGAGADTNMIHPDWLAYTNRLYASSWCKLWQTNDARSTLSWNGRLGNFGNTTVYNFYSSGEEVLRTFSGPPPSSILGLGYTLLLQYINTNLGYYSWVMQEKAKGVMPVVMGNYIMSSDHGGWGFNASYDISVSNILQTLPPARAATNSDAQLRIAPFFDASYDSALYTTNASGSTYAATNRNRILSDAIPAVTLPIGANPVPKLNPTGQNIDMMSFQNGWPLGRLQSTAKNEWHHSDLRVVAYTFNYQLYNQIVATGNLK